MIKKNKVPQNIKKNTNNNRPAIIKLLFSSHHVFPNEKIWLHEMKFTTRWNNSIPEMKMSWNVRGRGVRKVLIKTPKKCT